MFYIYANGESIFEPLEEDMILYEPKLTLEMGKAGALQFKVPPTHKFYDKFTTYLTRVTVEYDDEEIFRGRVLNNNKDFNNNRSIYCEGDLAYLLDSVQKSEKFTGKVHDLFNKIIAAHNDKVEDYKKFTVGQVTIDNRDIVVSGKSSEITKLDTKKFDYRQIVINSTNGSRMNTYEYIENTIIKNVGGYLHTHRENGVSYIDLVEEYVGSSTQVIEFGSNLLEMAEEVSTDDLFTVLIPLGESTGRSKENLTIAKVNGGSEELVDEAGVARYGRIVKTKSFGSVKKAKTLLENAQLYMQQHENAPMTFTIKAVDLHMINKNVQRIDVGDRVHVESRIHNVDRYITCSKIEYDFSNPANTAYTFGFPKQSLTERYRKDKTGGGGGSKKGSGGASGSNTGGDGTPWTTTLPEILAKYNINLGDQTPVEYACDVVENAFNTLLGSGGEVETAITEAKNDIFTSYIDLDGSDGRVTLKTIYDGIKDGKSKLKTHCGIDIDAMKGTVNIFSMKTDLDDTQRALASVSTQVTETAAIVDSRAVWGDNIANLLITASDQGTLIQMNADNIEANAESISLNAKNIEANAETIGLHTTSIGDIFKGLKTQCGIDINAPKGRVDIYSMKTDLDNNAKALANISTQVTNTAATVESRAEWGTNIANLIVTADAHGSLIEANANAIKLNGDNIEANAKTIGLHATDLKSIFTGLKTHCGIDINAPAGTVDIYSMNKDLLGNVKAVGSLTTRVTNTEASVKSMAKFGDRIASVEIKANKNESSINLKADKTSIESVKTEIKGEYEKQLKNMKDSLKRQCGIDIDAGKGRIDIFNVSKMVDENHKEIGQCAADIKTYSGDSKSWIEFTTLYKKDIESIADIKLQADENGSEIKLKADTVTVDGKFNTVNGEITNLKTDVANVEKLIADKIKAAFVAAYDLKAAKVSCISLTTGGITGQTLSISGTSSFSGAISAKGLNCSNMVCSGTMYMGSIWGDNIVATRGWVNDQGYVKPNTRVSATIFANNFDATGGILCGTTVSTKWVSAKENIWIAQKPVATQAWVTEQLDALKQWANETFASVTHKHKFTASAINVVTPNHTHNIEINGNKYTTNKKVAATTTNVKPTGTTGTPVEE